SDKSAQTWHAMPASAKSDRVKAASATVGANTRIRSSSKASFALFMGLAFAVESRADEQRPARQHALELPQRLPDVNALVEPQFPDRSLVATRPLLDDGDGLANFSHRLEVTQQQHRVGEVTGIHGRFNAAPREAVLGHEQ